MATSAPRGSLAGLIVVVAAAEEGERPGWRPGCRWRRRRRCGPGSGKGAHGASFRDVRGYGVVVARLVETRVPEMVHRLTGSAAGGRELAAKPRRSRRRPARTLLRMILRMSSLFVRTLRDDPADAEVPSHRLLVRAGYIRRAAPGIYTWLPLGLRVLRKIENIIREEMDAIGAQELLFPALLPREPYEASGRWTEYGDGIFRLKDRKDADYLLGPTHEEMFTLVVKDLYSSYKDLPLYDLPDPDQVPRRGAAPRRAAARPRVRDEGLLLLRHRRRRPRGELPAAPRRLRPDLRPARLRVRHRQGQLRRHGRLEVRGVPRQGRRRRGHLRALHRCDYAANVEAVDTPAPAPTSYDDAPAAHAEQTPDTPTIETLVAHLNTAFPRADRPWPRRHAEERALLAQPPRRHRRAPRDRPARRPRGRPEAARGPARRSRSRALRRGRLRQAPRRWPRATSAPACSGRRTSPASASWSTPASSRAPAGSPAPTSTAAT